MTFLSSPVIGIPNPSAVYCEKLGYTYKIDKTPQGERGTCIIKPEVEFKAWDFFKGKVGKEFSYCAKKGYDTETEIIDKGQYREEYAVCASKKNTKTIDDTEEKIRISMDKLMKQEKEPLIETKPIRSKGKEIQNNLKGDELGNLSSSFDWRNISGNSYIGGVRDQGYCGSCYAFGAAAAAEGTYNVAKNLTDENCSDFSEAFIAFCLSDNYGGFDGCNGANYEYEELDALIDEGIGACNDLAFPYTDVEQSCYAPAWNSPRIEFDSWSRIESENIDAIKTAIMTYGVIDAAVYVALPFQSYGGGIYTDSLTSCPDGYYTTTNHAISLVGWGYDETEGDYWILRNSWGSSWGENGYMRIAATSARVACSPAHLEFGINPKGRLTPNIINMPSEAKKNEFFSVETEVTCVNGTCGNVSSTLTLPSSQLRTCSETWGGDCSEGPPESFDNTFDSCSSGSGGDESIDEIYLDKSELNFGEEIEVNCYVEVKSLSCGNAYIDDNLRIYYRNSSAGNWQKKYYVPQVSSCHNYSIKFVPDNVEGEHQVRCITGWNISTSECGSGDYYDNDDINFSVYNNTLPMGYGLPFYTINQNPLNCLNMTHQSVCNQTWFVNATGDLNSSWLLYTSHESDRKGIKTKQTQKVNVTIVENFSPKLHKVECFDGSSWVDCSVLAYDNTIEQVRVNCTDIEGAISFASFKLTNVPDNNVFFDNNGTYNPSSGYFEYDNTDVLIEDSGDWELFVKCVDDQGVEGNLDIQWLVPWGVLQPYLINPVIDIDVAQNKFFNFSSGVSCVGGECGDVNATLDPEEPTQLIINQILADADVEEDYPSKNYGSESRLYVGYYGGDEYRTYLKYNLSSIPLDSEILNAELNLYYYVTNENYWVTVHNVYNNSWLEDQITWNNQPCSTTFNPAYCNLSYDDRIYINSVGWKKFNVRNILNTKISNGIVSFVLKPDDTGAYVIGARSKEYGSNIHYLNVTYVGAGEKGVIPMNNGTPFYTIDQNPETCSNLKDGDICESLWQVNATGELNTSYDFFTIYNPVTYSGYVVENETNKVKITILPNPRPTIHKLECQENNSVWTDCSNILYNDELTAVRANCTDADGVKNAYLQLVNIPDNYEFFNGNASLINGLWVYDNSDILIQDSGEFELTAYCADNFDNIGSEVYDWAIPFGVLQPYLIKPVSDQTVGQNLFFNFSSGVRCAGGECGDVNATLDPIIVLQPGITGKDSYAKKNVPDSNFGSENKIVISGYPSPSDYRSRGYFEFDLSSLPSGATVVSANFLIYRYDTWNSGSDNYGVHKVTSSWLENTISWNNQPTFSAVAEDVIFISQTDGVWRTWNITNLVESWMNGGVANYGIVVKAVNEGTASGGAYYSSDYGTESYRPKLEINYSIGGLKGIIPMDNGTPFYTIDQNPETCSNLKDGDVCERSWRVNATGDLNTSYDFFTIYEPVTYPSYIITNETEKVNITIVLPTLCFSDDDCDYLDNDYCGGDLIKHDEGRCTDYECSTETTTVEDCDDDEFCNGDETCVNAECQAGTPIDCSGNDLSEIATCDNSPDDNTFTWDYAAGFTSACDEIADECTTGTVSVTHTCDITNCSAECESDTDCSAKCVGNVYYYSGACESGCTCSYTTEDCSSYDGWYDTNSTQWVDTGECTEKEQKEQENRSYACGVLGCDYLVTSTQWVDTGATGNKGDGTACDDALYCTVNDQCTSGVCGGAARDCSANNLPEIATCDNSPDDNTFTWDYAAGFTSACDESNDECTSSTYAFTHTCDITQCSAECEIDNDCADTDCDYLDGCVGMDYHDYDDVVNSCQGDCSCESNACGAPNISINDSKCFKSYDLTLTPGWNLISLPLDPIDNSIALIMSGCSYNRIWKFENDQSWSSTDTGLTTMDIYHGYWIDRTGFSDNCTITIEGVLPNSITINITSSWILVGYPSLTSKPISSFINASLYNRIWEFQPDQSWRSTDTGLTNMTPGRGYWVDGTTVGNYEVVN